MSGIIYLVRNVVNHRVYVGQTTRTLSARSFEHNYDMQHASSTRFHRALRKYGPDSFDWQIIDEAETEQELNEKEKYWIQFYKSFDPAHGYNLTLGGEGGAKTQEVRDKLSAALKGKPLPLETRMKMSATRKGRKLSEETKQKISKAYHTKHSDEYRQKMSLKLKAQPLFKGKHHSLETRRKMSESRTGRHLKRRVLDV